MTVLIPALLAFTTAQADGPHIRSPLAGEVVSAGSERVALWPKALLQADAVSVEFSADDGKTWSIVSPSSPNSGEFHWKAPDAATEAARLRVTPTARDASSVVSGRFSVGPSTRGGPYRWELVNPRAAFAARDGAGALSFQGKLWLLGGWNPSDKKFFPRVCNNEVWNTGDGKSWGLVRPNTYLDKSFNSKIDWEGRHTAGYAVFKDRMWVVGGDANQGHHQDDVWSSADGVDWRREGGDAPPPWAPRALHYTVVFRDHLWVIGGQTMPGFAPVKERFYQDVWKSADGATWEEVRPEGPIWSPRGMIGGSAVLNGRIWVIGGGTYDTPTTPTRQYFNDVWSTADGVRWARHTEQAPWKARQYHEVAAFDGRLWALEGYAGANRNDVWSSADGSNWYELKDTPWKPRHAASVVAFDGALWVVAGNNMEPDVWKLVRDE